MVKGSTVKRSGRKEKVKEKTYQKLAEGEFQSRTQNSDRAISAYEKNVMRP